MNTAVIIPARYQSSRLPGKPLLRETGKYLVQHVYEQALQSKATEVIVATDDRRIFQAVQSFGGAAVMTDPKHPSGADRAAEAARDLDAEIIINLQGDEPLIDPQHLDQVADLLRQHHQAAQMASLAVPIVAMDDYLNPNCVKVVCDSAGRALYFSRSPIPFVRDGEPDFNATPHLFLRHIGLYGYRRNFLLEFASARPHYLEHLEKLEQLRAIGLGATIQIGVVAHSAGGIDTPEDYERFVHFWKNRRHAA